ncbi:MAG: aconitase/3-isopropylmalate dehydratase large subunit family protein [Chloroflexota bacterium]|nr:aconitase/3-isopropylmalate dehydratase large subunit family protein [Chloroflexota bacterium]
MPGQTIIQKIFAAHSTGDVPVEPGNIIWLDLDVRSARDFAGPNVVKNYREHYGDAPVADPAKTCFTFDLVAPPSNIPYAINQQLCRVWAREQGVKVYDVNAGIGSHVAIEEGLAYPGSTFVGTDSHLNILGAVGAFGQGMGDQDIAFAFKTGRTWFEVPPTMKVVVEGELRYPCTARDLTLAVLRRLGSHGALGRAIEFYGPAIESLDLAGRITLASQVTEVGGIVGFPISGSAAQRLSGSAEQQVDKSLLPNPYSLLPDPNADYIETVTIDITDLEPLIACPPSPTNVKPVREVAGTRVDSVFIGSCTNGRFEDFAAVAEVVRGKRIAPHVMASVVPSTRSVYAQMLHSGVLATLFDAGFIISNPGCGGCASGHLGMTGAGQVNISTSNRNFPGKQGPGDTCLASPVTAAWCALRGEIVVP